MERTERGKTEKLSPPDPVDGHRRWVDLNSWDPDSPEPELMEVALSAMREQWSMDILAHHLSLLGRPVGLTKTIRRLIRAHGRLGQWEQMRPDITTMTKAWELAFTPIPKTPGVQTELTSPRWCDPE